MKRLFSLLVVITLFFSCLCPAAAFALPEIVYEAQTGGYWSANEWNPLGAWTDLPSTSAKKTNVIPVTPGDQLSYTGYAADSPDSVIWLDDDMYYLSDEKYDALGEPVIVTAPEYAAYVWFASFQFSSNIDNVPLDVSWVLCQADGDASDSVQANHTGIKDVLSGKKIVYDGDSIAESRFNSDTDNGGSYPQLIANAVENGVYVNLAKDGATLSASSEQHSIVNDLDLLPKDGDLYCFEGGINDYWADVPLGTYTLDDFTGELDPSTLSGALETIFRYSLTNFVGKPICFVIPHKVQKTAYRPNGAGHTFKDYRDTIVAICEKYSIPYYDAFSSSGLNGWNKEQSNAFLNLGDGADGIHPNTEGYRRYYVPQLLSLFRSIMPAD